MRKTKPAVWLDILLIAAAVGVGYFLVSVLPRFAPVAVVMDTAGETELSASDTDVREGRLPGYEDAKVNSNPEYFWYLYNGKVNYENPSAPGNVMLENTQGNTCDMQVVYALESGEEVYRSPMMHPGEYLMYDTLDKTMPAGKYDVNVTIYVYSAATATDAGAQEGQEQTETETEIRTPFATYSERAHLTIGEPK